MNPENPKPIIPKIRMSQQGNTYIRIIVSIYYLILFGMCEYLLLVLIPKMIEVYERGRLELPITTRLLLDSRNLLAIGLLVWLIIFVTLEWITQDVRARWLVRMLAHILFLISIVGILFFTYLPLMPLSR